MQKHAWFHTVLDKPIKVDFFLKVQKEDETSGGVMLQRKWSLILGLIWRIQETHVYLSAPVKFYLPCGH